MNSRNSKLSAFTLIELLVVLAIIGILAALLFPAVAKAKRDSRRVLASAEVSQLQQAIGAYIRDHRGGPKADFDEVDISGGASLEVDPIPIDEDFAKILSGQNVNGNNPMGRKYMDFRRFDATGIPVTPWWTSKATPVDTKRLYRYFVKIDANYDDIISKGAKEPDDPPNNDVRSPVIVWAYNTDVAKTEKSYVIRSWDQ